MDIIFPCAGQSSRFPETRPKYLLVEYSGKLMIEKSAENTQGRKHIVILREHIINYDAENIVRDAFGDSVNIIVLESPTNGPAETIYLALKRIGNVQDFIVRDCDSFFNFESQSGNIVYTSKLSNNLDLNDVSGLSYVIANNQNVVSNIIEKQVVSDTFCVGGYQFSSAEEYYEAYSAIKESNGELYISNIIGYMISNGKIFQSKNVTNYINVGVLDAWLKYNYKPTIFCDIDGVLVKNQAAHGINSYGKKLYEPLETNIKAIRDAKSKGAQIVFVTARPEKYRKVTQKILDENGLNDCILIMGLHHAQRILINDFTTSNPYPSAVAINLKRNENNLKDYL